MVLTVKTMHLTIGVLCCGFWLVSGGHESKGKKNMILHHLLLSLLLLQIVAKKDKDFLKRMTRQSLKEATCIKAKVTANRRTGTSNVVFRIPPLGSFDDHVGHD